MPLLRPARLRKSRRDPKSIAVVDVLQHFVRQVEAVQLPEGVVIAVVVEVVIGGLEDPPEVGILTGLERVLAEEDPVLVPKVIRLQ